MQLLIEEFFKKLFKFINSLNIWLIKWIVKLIFYILIAGIITYILISIYRKNLLPIVIIIGILILGESAHYLRKTREKKMNEKITEENSIKKPPKNKSLLKKLPKNKNLLKKSKPLTNLKTLQKTKTISTKHKIDTALIKTEKAKNKTLLKTSKPKNESLLKNN